MTPAEEGTARANIDPEMSITFLKACRDAGAQIRAVWYCGCPDSCWGVSGRTDCSLCLALLAATAAARFRRPINRTLTHALWLELLL